MQRITVRISKDSHNFIEKYRIENNLEDVCDAVRAIINEKKENKNSFFSKLKNLFK